MKQTVSFTGFKQAFKDSSRGNQFTDEGFAALYNHLTESEADSGKELELDVIAICCDYTEDALENVLDNYRLESIEDLKEQTTVIEFENPDGAIIYVNF